MRIPFEKELESFVLKVDEYLSDKNNQKEVKYPRDSVSPWNSDCIIQENEQLLQSVSGSANIYAIYCSDKDSESYELRYIGKSSRKLARQRLTNHLVKKHERTGAKLSKVIDHVQAGGKIKISWTEITPESMRNCVEEELIRLHQEATWNRENA
ncbi:GIY-YIG nuclease family protein [Plesiomonas shigelloides]|uniref:GIY-YIG nuclease family protein n=1 Tax=Plesiomonas shigelloides TaxID=703 RepID=UPI001262613B|nr:GIY-YIG nuclease family protein [Plesiomonas shigelloides]KAB7696254.1 hypothetical protein GBN15_10380 [Plesiomonas shigelloides]